MVPVREIGAANRPLEQHIAYQGKPRRMIDVHDVPWGVPWAVQDAEPVVAE